MKKQFSDQEVNNFISDLIQTYSQSIYQEPYSPSPFFMARLHARTREKQTLANFWETGVIKAQNWLVAFSLIALFFFVSNIVVNRTPSSVPDDVASESLALGEHEWDHFNEYPPQSREVSKP